VSEESSLKDQPSLRDAEPDELTADERSQISARLRLTPAARLRYLMDVLTFEERARRARRLG
jgi:hypothetical protein